jgi:predicted amidohydrolase YtcJ
MRQIIFLILFFIVFALLPDFPSFLHYMPPTSTIYYNGSIITMHGPKPVYAEAIVIKDNKIIFVGLKDSAIARGGGNPKLVDLKGRALLPGFIDAHSHLMKYADAPYLADLNPPPIGKINRIADILAALQDLKMKHKLSDSSWLIGNGYDQDLLEEKRHPLAADLDSAFPNNPVLLFHTSGHMLVANSKAFELAAINEKTPDPKGGTILRIKRSKKPEGLVQEMAMYAFSPFLYQEGTEEFEMNKLYKAQEYYAAYGITTAAEHSLPQEKLPLLEKAIKNKTFFIDLAVVPSFALDSGGVGTGKITFGNYRHHVKYAGLQMAIDGSPQGKTAFLTQPYLTPVTGCEKDCRGFPYLTQDQVNERVLLCYSNKVQLFSHCNGDSAIDMMIKGHQYANAALKDSTADRRTVILHSQVMRPDQLSTYLKYSLVPSFFTNHTFYWGDDHFKNLGKERAFFLSPLRSALKMGIKATNHTGCNITPADQMFLVWTAVNRITRSGFLLGKEERVSAYDALRAITANAAYQYHEENIKGSLEPGKLADLVILSKNPLTENEYAIKNIEVLETIKEGKTIYRKKKN